MPCRIGITTNLDARRAYWESEYRNVRDWQLLGTFDTKAEAQAEETRRSLMYGCESSPGGDDPDWPGALWYVYGFNHDGKKLPLPRPAYTR